MADGGSRHRRPAAGPLPGLHDWHMMRFWAWFDVHRARLWQIVCAAAVVAAFTLIVVVIMLAAL